MKSIMSVFNLSHKIDNNIIINDLSFSLENNSVNAVLSSNKSGKTTLIKLLSGIIYHDSGNIIVNNIELNKDNFKKYIVNISTILEDIEDQFICDTVKEEIKYPLIKLNYNTTVINDLFMYVTSILKIKSIVNKKIDELSYYEKIKVLIAASIIHSPKVLLVDDILRFLDSNQKEDIIKLFKIIVDELDMTILFTTSNLNDVVDVSNIFVLNNGNIVMNGDYQSIIMKDNELSKMGIEIPLMVDLSRKLQFYNLIDKIYYDPDKVVDALWK